MQIPIVGLKGQQDLSGSAQVDAFLSPAERRIRKRAEELEALKVKTTDQRDKAGVLPAVGSKVELPVTSKADQPSALKVQELAAVSKPLASAWVEGSIEPKPRPTYKLTASGQSKPALAKKQRQALNRKERERIAGEEQELLSKVKEDKKEGKQEVTASPVTRHPTPSSSSSAQVPRAHTQEELAATMFPQSGRDAVLKVLAGKDVPPAIASILAQQVAIVTGSIASMAETAEGYIKLDRLAKSLAAQASEVLGVAGSLNGKMQSLVARTASAKELTEALRSEDQEYATAYRAFMEKYTPLVGLLTKTIDRFTKLQTDYSRAFSSDRSLNDIGLKADLDPEAYRKLEGMWSTIRGGDWEQHRAALSGHLETLRSAGQMATGLRTKLDSSYNPGPTLYQSVSAYMLSLPSFMRSTAPQATKQVG